MTTLSLILMVAITAIGAAFLLRGARAMFSFTFIAILAVTGLYIFDFLRMPEHARWTFMLPGDYERLLVLASVFLLVFGCGERLGTGCAHGVHVAGGPSGYSLAWLQIGMAALALGLLGKILFIHSSGGFLAMYGAAHGKGANFTTAYIYRLPLSMFSGCVILICFYLSGYRISMIARVALVLALALLFFDLFTQGKRGGLIRFALMAAVPLLILTQLSTRQRVYFLLGCAGCLALLVLLPYIRWALSLSSIHQIGYALASLPDVAEKYSVGGTLFTEGKHVVFAANTVGASIEDPNPNYGARWIFPLISLIPRSVWPDKPYRYDFAYDFYDAANAYISFRIPQGSYPGGIVESFVEWSYPVVGVWFVMGVLLGYLRGYALNVRSPFGIVLLFGAACFFTQFALQDFIQGFLNAMFLLGPLLVISLAYFLLPQKGTALQVPHGKWTVSPKAKTP